MKEHFEIMMRNSEHWDIWADRQRLYRIRGKQGNIKLWGDNTFSDKPEREFTSVQSCMAEICAEFMTEIS